MVNKTTIMTDKNGQYDTSRTDEMANKITIKNDKNGQLDYHQD